MTAVRFLVHAVSLTAVVAMASAFTSTSGPGGGPPNDNCANAIAIGLGGTAFTTLDASIDGSASCTGTTGPDVWFTYTAGFSGTLLVSTCGSADYDTLLNAFDGATCPPGAELACNDQACASDQSEISFVVTAGQDYTIRVAGWNNATGSGTLNLSIVSVANDDCANALPISLGETPFDLATTTQDGTASCTATPGPDIWYTYTSTFDGTLLVSTCGTANFDTVLNAYNGATCPPGAELACNDQACASDQSEISFVVTAGQDYTIRVAGWNNNSGSGTVQLSQVGDTCEVPIPATDGSYVGNNADNTTSGVDCGFGSTFDEWYLYTATCTGVATATTCGAITLDTTLAVFNACGESAIRCDDQDDCDGSPSNQELIRWEVTAGEDYYIQVAGWNGLTGDYQLDISCDDCPADFVGTGDGFVNVSELLELLAAWGSCDDCPQDINGDGQVNVSDLLFLLAAWGPCP